MKEKNVVQNGHQMGMSFKVKLSLILISVIILPVILVGVASYQGAKNILTRDFKSNSRVIAEKMNETLSTFITNHEQNLELVSNNSNVTEIKSMPPEDHVYLKDLLKDTHDSHPDILNTFYGLNDKTMFLYPEAQLGADYDPRIRIWYTMAAEKKSMVWTDPYVDAGTGKVVVSVTKPVNDSKGEFTGVIGADISLETLSEFVSKTKIGTSGYFFITDKNGIVLAHPDANLVNKPIENKAILTAIANNTNAGFNFKEGKGLRYANILTNEKVGWKIVGVISYSEINAKTSSIFITILVAAIVVILVGLFVALLVSTPITRSLATIVNSLKQIGSGDLTAKAYVKSKDEFGVLAHELNTMSGGINDLMKQIHGIASNIANASDTLAATSEETSASTEEIAKTVDEVAGATNDQAKSTEEALLKVNQLSDSIQRVSDAIDNMRREIEEAIKLNFSGNQTVKLLTEKTLENNKASNRVSEVISEVDNRTKEIGFIIETIGQIAQQTNLLALNASIEAARAGEAGKGFSVVADEIRKLAEQSSGAANQIRDLITGIQSQAKNAVDSMQTSKETNAVQSEAVSQTEKIFNDITNSINTINREIDSILKLNSSMVTKKEEIVSVVENISATSEETAASAQEISASTQQQHAAVEEVANTASELNGMAVQLNSSVERFKLAD